MIENRDEGNKFKQFETQDCSITKTHKAQRYQESGLESSVPKHSRDQPAFARASGNRGLGFRPTVWDSGDSTKTHQRGDIHM